MGQQQAQGSKGAGVLVWLRRPTATCSDQRLHLGRWPTGICASCKGRNQQRALGQILKT
uniref:Uncharacterized protein n=1 Tax=Oryza sativa subsp. japonica TaxID=39947 RepID=Q6K5E7_ORYSJ|nr:hypothetical protein [Oryza sativa Japonica Group]